MVAYRENARGEPRKASFWYGPFPPSGQGAGFVAAFVVLAPLAISVATQKRTLTCDRQTGLCVFDSTNLVGERRTTSFPIADVSDVRLVEGSGKSKSNAECVLVFRSGRDFRLPSEARDAATAEHARLQSFFAGGAPRVHEEHEVGTTARLFLIGLAMLMGVFALSSLGKSLPLRVQLASDRLWIPRKKRSFDVSSATKVAVEPHPENAKLRRVAVLSGEDVDFVLREGRAGVGAHQRAARKLGELLSVPTELGPDPARKPFVFPRVPQKIPLGWKLLVGAIVLATLSMVGIERYAARTQGTVEIDCQGRCRFENMECLPGGSVSMSAPPGEFQVETWAPDSPTHWKTNRVPVTIGATTKFVCPPTQ